jgi:hypothetical protein
VPDVATGEEVREQSVAPWPVQETDDRVAKPAPDDRVAKPAPDDRGRTTCGCS